MFRAEKVTIILQMVPTFLQKVTGYLQKRSSLFYQDICMIFKNLHTNQNFSAFSNK